MTIAIRRAEAGDVHKIEELLTGAGVRRDGVVDNIGGFLLVEEDLDGEKRAVGTVGLEMYEGKYGVMRSLVMRREASNAEQVADLLRLFLAYAQAQGVEELYLLTVSTGYAPFIHMGFSTALPEEIPAAVAQCQHFLAYRTERVIPLVKKYESTSYPHAHVDSVENKEQAFAGFRHLLSRRMLDFDALLLY